MTEIYGAETALTVATDRLVATIDGLSDEDVRGPSLLPGWTRGHVLAHIARNADAMRNLVTSARTGADIPMYPSRERRDADIERDAPRPSAEHRRDLAESARALGDDVRAL
ncbi:MAG: maleylpyruvate isomerase N-terminal domain-containing protein, partial [Streptosporangiaceae bacterium]